MRRWQPGRKRTNRGKFYTNARLNQRTRGRIGGRPLSPDWNVQETPHTMAGHERVERFPKPVLPSLAGVRDLCPEPE